MKRKGLTTCAALALLAAGAATLRAEELLPGGSLTNADNTLLPGDAFFTEGDVNAVTAYAQFVDEMSTPIGGLGHHYTGAIHSRLWTDGQSGGIAFEYWFEIDGHAGPGIFSSAKSATIGGDWAPFAVVDAGAARAGQDGAGVSAAVAGLGGGGWNDGSPLLIARDDLAGHASPKVFFEMAPFAGTHMLQGQRSAHFWLATDATAYGVANMVILDGGLEGQGPVFVPVPEPATALLLTLGFAIRRR